MAIVGGPRLSTVGNSLWDDLLAYYTADNTPNDALGNYNGTLTNGATYGTGIINQGFSLDGTNDCVDIGSRQIFNNTQSFTYSAWVYADSIRNRSIITGGNVTSGGGSLGMWSNGFTRNIALLVGPGTSQFIGNTALTTSTWYHLVAVHTPHDGVSNNVQLYLNGSDDGSGILNIGTSTASFNQYIGSSTNGVAYFGGIIDEAAIWNRDLSSSEVTELYNGGSGLQYPN